MIDTIKFLVPIDDIIFLESLKTVFIENKKEDLNTKEIKYAYYSSEVYVGSHSKKIIIRLEEKFYTGLSIEFSIPKYAKGNNIEMIWPSELSAILNTLYTELCFHLGVVLPDVATWKIQRLDLCYNWIFTTKEEAENVMGFLQRIEYPRKKKVTLGDLDDVVGVARRHRIDGMIVGNTTISRPNLREQVKAKEAGGLSGRPLFALSTRMLAETFVRAEGAFPLIGAGGIDSGAAAFAKIKAGASLIQLYTGLIFRGVGLVGTIKRDLVDMLRVGRFDTLDRAVGRDAASITAEPWPS